MIVAENPKLKMLLKSNEVFKMNFEKLMLAFEKRIWTKDVCTLFKALCESLFRDHGIPVVCHIKENIVGDGRFVLEFV